MQHLNIKHLVILIILFLCGCHSTNEHISPIGEHNNDSLSYVIDSLYSRIGIESKENEAQTFMALDEVKNKVKNAPKGYLRKKDSIMLATLWIYHSPCSYIRWHPNDYPHHSNEKVKNYIEKPFFDGGIDSLTHFISKNLLIKYRNNNIFWSKDSTLKFEVKFNVGRKVENLSIKPIDTQSFYNTLFIQDLSRVFYILPCWKISFVEVDKPSETQNVARSISLEIIYHKDSIKIVNHTNDGYSMDLKR